MKNECVTVAAQETSSLSFHVEDGQIVVDESTFGDQTPEMIAAIFPRWMLDDLLDKKA